MTSRGPEPTIDILFSAEQIAARVEKLADEIVAGSADAGGELLVVVILKGNFVFAADLIRALDRAGASARVDFIYPVKLWRRNSEFWDGDPDT